MVYGELGHSQYSRVIVAFAEYSSIYSYVDMRIANSEGEPVRYVKIYFRHTDTTYRIRATLC